MPDGPCLGCEVVAGRRGSVLYRTEYWTVSHNVNRSPAGPWVIVQPVEHRATLADLDAPTLAELGEILARIERVLRLLDPEVDRVYVAVFNEWDAGHVHAHVVAVDHAVVASSHGAELRGAELMAARATPYDPADFAPLAERFRDAMTRERPGA